MFSCELKFVIDILKKWLSEKYFRRFKELDFLPNENLRGKIQMTGTKQTV